MGQIYMARKSKGFGEILNQQRASKAEQKGLEKLQKKIQKGPLGNQFAAGMLMNPKGEVKMSEVLEAFVEPYLDFAQTRSQRETLFSIAVFAWNLAILPESGRQAAIDELIKVNLKGSSLLAEQDMREIIAELIARKQNFFANNKRYIVDFELQDTDKQFHLSVASTLSSPPAAN